LLFRSMRFNNEIPLFLGLGTEDLDDIIVQTTRVTELQL
jgi:hypothetical protein